MKNVIFVAIITVLALNLVIVDYYLLQPRPTPVVENPSVVVTPSPIPTLASPSITSIPTLSPKPTNSQTKIVKLISYIPIPGNGQSQSNSWDNLSGSEFYFDTHDFPNQKSAIFEASLKLLNSNGIAFVRLFDVTDGIEVWGSDLSTKNQNYTFLTSAPLTLRPGKHLYRIQLKSLTADTTVLNFGRLKIISEN